MIKLHFEKIYSTEARQEPCTVAVPLKQGKLVDLSGVRVYNEKGEAVPTQAQATANYSDGSVKWLFVRFMANVPARQAVDYSLSLKKGEEAFEGIKASNDGVATGALSFTLSTDTGCLFESIAIGEKTYGCDYITAPILTDRDGKEYTFKTDSWDLEECGEVCAIIRGEGWYSCKGEKTYMGEIKLTCYKDKPWIEVAPRLINTTNNELSIDEWSMSHNNIYEMGRRCVIGRSNYRTAYEESQEGEEISFTIDENYLIYEANEHNAEVFYGTFFADCTDDEGGLCATIFQAQQNFPKAFKADKNGFTAYLVPPATGRVIMQPGMARQQRILFDFHKDFEPIESVNDTSVRYQMPNKPLVDPKVFEKSGIFEDVFTHNSVIETENFLNAKADDHNRCYGMLNWGDSPDMGYTSQGRGNGELVWTNNEYDFCHACSLMYVRTGVRRFMDYVLASGRHWIDVDICHYSDDPLILNGQWEHTNGHCKNGKIECSHQWVEGLLDYYHFTAEPEAYTSAIEIGKNVLRQLETPKFHQSGEINARETGWAMRTLVALYKETGDESWLEKCDWIVSHFEDWEKKYGLWLSPYTDNTEIRVVFMIAVAIGSLMRYYRVKPQKKIKDMILRAVDDLIENARLDNGLFYYKELPSLKRFGNNPIILEALAIAYELTGDSSYLEAGIPTAKYVVVGPSWSLGGKRIMEDAVLTGGAGSKRFAQLMIPVTTYYSACVKAGMGDKLR